MLPFKKTKNGIFSEFYFLIFSALCFLADRVCKWNVFPNFDDYMLLLLIKITLAGDDREAPCVESFLLAPFVIYSLFFVFLFPLSFENWNKTLIKLLRE